MKRCLYAGTLSLPLEVKDHLNRNQVDLVENPYRKTLTEEDLASLLGDFDAVLAGPEPYSERVIQSCRKLKIIARTGVGYDKIDLPAASRRGVYVTWTPIPELAYSMAEQTFGLMLSFVKRISYLNSAVREGRWERAIWSEEVNDLYPLTLGLFGLGRIGSEVARRAKAFGMKLIYFDAVRMADLEESIGIKFVPFDELLSNADILSIHVPLTPDTRTVINEDAIRKMKRNAIVVNTARGAIVDERALANALLEGRLAGAMLDVLTEEPPTERHPFYKLGERIPNLIITPHVGVGRHTLRAMALAAADDVVRALNGEVPKYLLNRDVIQNQ